MKVEVLTHPAELQSPPVEVTEAVAAVSRQQQLALGETALSRRPVATEPGDPYFRHPMVAIRTEPFEPPKAAIEARWNETTGKIEYYRPE